MATPSPSAPPAAPEPSSTPSTTTTTIPPAPSPSGEDNQLVSALNTLQVSEVDGDVTDESGDPTLHTGELIIRQAGFQNPGEGTVLKITSFQNLPISEALKKSVASLGWQSMSKIQQFGLPLILSDPPRSMIAQAQAGTGKTGTFVLGALARINPAQKNLSQPQAVILAGTQELVTQIAQVITLLGKDSGVAPRRVMGAGRQGGNQAGGGRGRPGGRPGGGGGPPGSGAPAALPEWDMAPGTDFAEQIIVGTPHKVLNLVNDFKRGRKPCIDPSQIKVLVLDEADTMVLEAPQGSGREVKELRDLILAARKDTQLLLFSATYTPTAWREARDFVTHGSADKKNFHEIQLKSEDITLDKVDNFFMLIGSETDSEQTIDQLKFKAIVQIWESMASSPLLGQSVIFVSKRERAQGLADYLRSEGYNVGQIHGDMEKTERGRVFQEFKDNKRPALVATNVLSRGIDAPNVTLVINVDMPEKSQSHEPDPETFVHRIGRSGRWTKTGASISLVSAHPRASDKRIMAAIERQLFAAVDRPLIRIADPTQVGEALAKRAEERVAARRAAAAAAAAPQ